jgi:transcription elongation GreA/GreB family factor
LQRRLVELESLIEGVEIVEKVWSKAATITYGSHVTLDIEWDGTVEIDIVSTGEVFVWDVLKLSFESPLGKILEGKKKWDELVLKLPTVNKKVKILSVA